ncbi:flagellar basal body P-ring formation chaperone FlgA [Devosia sp.]|uniref:flagellar basal body P-ring formation chaperone FlgA n=1 Tax=Devosia sp. TaxID=1871048 RepID=UPI003BAA612A
MKLSLIALTFALLATPALAAPILKSDVTVTGPLVTLGDMFDDAGALAATPLFRAPAPGTSGLVGLDAIRQAASNAGLVDFDRHGLLEVGVARSGTVVDGVMLNRLIADELQRRGLLSEGIEVEARFSQQDPSFNAEAVADPVQLANLQYTPGSKSFAARFTIAGMALPVDVSGTIDLMIEVPHLANNLQAGAVLTPADIEMKKVPADYADATGVDTVDQLVGKALRRNAREGLMLKLSDVTEPLVIKRNADVLVLFHSGPMTLSLEGKALSDASTGQLVQILNPVSRKIFTGTATATGTVEVGFSSTKLAGL